MYFALLLCNYKARETPAVMKMKNMLEKETLCPAMLFRSYSPWANLFACLYSASSCVTHMLPAVYLARCQFFSEHYRNGSCQSNLNHMDCNITFSSKTFCDSTHHYFTKD